MPLWAGPGPHTAFQVGAAWFFQRRSQRLEARIQAADFAWKILTNLASCQVRQNGERPHHFGELSNKSLFINKLKQL